MRSYPADRAAGVRSNWAVASRTFAMSSLPAAWTPTTASVARIAINPTMAKVLRFSFNSLQNFDCGTYYEGAARSRLVGHPCFVREMIHGYYSFTLNMRDDLRADESARHQSQ